MGKCAAQGCNYHSGYAPANVTFHRFPKDEALRKKWTAALGRRDWVPTKWSCVCSVHFHESDIDRTSMVRIRIKEGAVPTIFTNLSSPVEDHFEESQFESLCKDRKKLRKTAVPTLFSIPYPLPYVTDKRIRCPKPNTQLGGNQMVKKGLLDRLKEGVVIGDGGFVFSLEKRGYVKAGPWTPEAAVEHPDAVKSLHREFLRAGSDVMQAFTFYASDDKLINRGNQAGKLFSGSDINEAACRIAREVADEGDALVAGGISQTPSYLSGKGKESVQAEFRKQVQVFTKNKVDFLICEYFEHIEEMEWAIEVCKETDLPVAATMCIGTEGDLHNKSVGECAVRMAIAGADVVGLNCHFDPFKMLEAIALMKTALSAAGLKPYLMSQPLAFHTPDAGKQGFIDLPEFPFALEPRVCTRWEMQRYAREAYDLGVRYIGGCCGFESYHIRAVSEELAKERGKQPESSKKHDPWGEGLKMHTKPWVRARARRSYWENLNPSTGRPYSSAFSKPDNWGVTAGSEELKQQAESTTVEELQKVFAHNAK